MEIWDIFGRKWWFFEVKVPTLSLMTFWILNLSVKKNNSRIFSKFTILNCEFGNGDSFLNEISALNLIFWFISNPSGLNGGGVVLVTPLTYYLLNTLLVSQMKMHTVITSAAGQDPIIIYEKLAISRQVHLSPVKWPNDSVRLIWKSSRKSSNNCDQIIFITRKLLGK